MKQRGGLSKTSDHRHRDSPSVKKKVMRRSRSRPHILSTHPSHQREKFGVEDFVASQFEVKFRQAEALSRLKGRTNVRVWAFESVNFKEGSRKYFAAPIRLFYLKVYRQCDEWPRNFYEVIPEDAPCRLYFDLEYKRCFNEGVDADVMMERFLQTVIDSIDELFQLRLDRDRSFMILDSSTNEKFSSHVIVHMPERRLFPSNLALKPLVQYICRKMLECQVGLVQVGDSEGNRHALMCDTSVYTRNRNFRLYRSSKCGKSAVLEVSKLCRFYEERPWTNANVFLDSIVVPKDYTLYEVLKMPAKLKSILSTDPSLLLSNLPARLTSSSILRSLNIVSDEKSPIDEIERGSGPSPFPEVDKFMLSIFRTHNARAEIRVWCFTISKMSGGRSIQYQLNNCRYCYNKGREHKSQNVYWVVDLDRFVYYQRCFDVLDCPKFESERWKLPDEVARSVVGRIFSTCFESR